MEHTTTGGPSAGRRLARFAAAVVAVSAVGALALAPGAAAVDAGQTASEIDTAKIAKVGTVLVAGGDTVYTLKPSKTTCDAKCLKAWPPVVLPQGMTAATAGSGVDASKLGTTTTDSGALQVTYDGKPLFWFVKDKAEGQVKGNVTDKWGKWAAVVTEKSSSGGSGGSGKSDAGSSTAF